MSISKCCICGEMYDTDEELEVNELGDCICDNCAEEHSSQCDCCGEDRVCRCFFSESQGETNVCHECSKSPREK